MNGIVRLLTALGIVQNHSVSRLGAPEPGEIYVAVVSLAQRGATRPAGHAQPSALIGITTPPQGVPLDYLFIN